MPPLYESPFPVGQLSPIWALIVDMLQADPVLQSAITTWQVYAGEDTDTEAVSFEQLPAVRITPRGGSWSWTDETRHAGPLILDIELAIPGTCAAHLMDGWECLHRALWDGTNDLLNTLIPLGCYQKTSSGPAIAPQVFGAGQGISAKGTITLSLNLDS